MHEPTLKRWRRAHPPLSARHTPPGVAACLLLLTAACGRPAEPPAWQAIDPDAIEDRLDNPTATRAAIDLDADELRLAVDAASSLLTLTEDALDQVLGATDDQPPPTDDQVYGTTFYVRVGCPGPGSGPDADFAFGDARIDSPLLLSADFVPIVGPFLLQLDGCEVGDLTLDATLRGHWVAERTTLFASGAVDAASPEIDDRLEVEMIVAADQIRVGVPLGDGRATLALTNDPLRLTIYLADTTLTCREVGDQLECTEEVQE